MPTAASPLPATVLAVDDTPDNLSLIGELLRPLYHVRVANSGERALRAARSEPRPDLILLDVMMPGMDGYAVLERLRADPATRDIPVIFVTALDTLEDEERGLRLGAVDYVTKPIRPAILLARVRSQLALKQARDVLLNHNDALERAVARRMAESERIKAASLHALALLAEVRDNETGNHLHRTGSYVQALADQLAHHPQYAPQLGPTQVAAIVAAAPLHDIGKVGIPDHILHKAGKLAPHEYEVMKRHARIGADAIEQAMVRAHPEHAGARAPVLTEDDAGLAFLEVARQIARHHHERWDGSGYPDGLAGEAIPLPARLMALADVYDALSSHRVYKPAMPDEVVHQTVLAGRGTHFDPAVVDAYVAASAGFRRIRERHRDVQR